MLFFREENMKRCWCVLLVFVLFAACTSKTTIVEESDHLRISKGDYKLAASRVQDMESAYMVVSWMNVNGMDYLDAFLCCMPMNHVQFLHDRYGNFMRCSSRGADAAKQCTMHLEVILSDPSYRTVLDMVEKAKKERMFPVIRVSGREISIDDVTYKEVPFSTLGGSSTVVLAESIEMEQENYPF